MCASSFNFHHIGSPGGPPFQNLFSRTGAYSTKCHLPFLWHHLPFCHIFCSSTYHLPEKWCHCHYYGNGVMLPYLWQNGMPFAIAICSTKIMAKSENNGLPFFICHNYGNIEFISIGDIKILFTDLNLMTDKSKPLECKIRKF